MIAWADSSFYIRLNLLFNGIMHFETWRRQERAEKHSA